MAGQMSNRTLDREVKKVASAYRRKLTTKSAASSTHKEEEEEDKDEGSEKPGRPDETGLLAKGKEEEEVSGSGGQTSLDHQGALTQAEVESAMTVVRVLPVVECFSACGWVEGCVCVCVCVCVCECV